MRLFSAAPQGVGPERRKTMRWSRILLFVNSFLLLLPQIRCLSYIEKGMLDRLLTYYDEKVRPADKRNFLADPTSPPVVINASLAIRHVTFRDSVLTLDLELKEAWYDSRLQGSEKVRQRFQLPGDMRVWVPQGAPETNSKPSACQNRKLYISDTARLESQCRFVVQVDCQGGYLNFPFDSHACLVELEAADSTDVSYLCDSCLEDPESSIAPPFFTIRSFARTHSLSKSDTYISLLDSLTTTISPTTVAPRLKRRKPIKKNGKMARTAKKRTTPVYDVYDYEEETPEDQAARMRLAIGRTIALEVVLTRSAAGYYVVTAMLPAALMVMLAWISAFSQRKMIEITMQSTAVFALILLWGNHRYAPAVTALDLWLLCCLCFICAAIAESTLLACFPSIRRSGSRTSMAKRTESASSVNRVVLVANDTHQPNGGLFVHVEHCSDSVKRLVDQERIHLAFVALYPVAFLVLSLVFWLPRLP